MVHVEDLVSYVVIAAMGIAVLLLITGKFIDLTVEKQTFTQTRSTINLLQKIVTDGPILVKDPEGNPKKLMIDKTGYQAADLSECCDSVQYDYEFNVGTFEGQYVVSPTQTYYNVQTGGFATKTNVMPKAGGESRPYSTGDQCYYEFRIGNAKGAKIPVNICEKDVNGNYMCTQGVAGLETRDTPLSQLSSWLTQVCASNFETSKRIPLANKDYQTGYDVTVEKDGEGNNFVCLDGNCKRFECPLGVETRTDKTLLDNKIGLYTYFTCNFVVISKKDNKVILYEGYDEAESAFPDAPDFPPNDEWTEDKYEIYKPGDSSKFEVTNVKIGSIEAAKGEKYITFKIKKGSGAVNTENQPVYLRMSDISKELSEFSSELECGNGNECVKMKDGDKVKYPVIRYQARIYSDDKKEPMEGQLTWKLTDTSGNCIVKRLEHPVLDIIKFPFTGEIGQGKPIINNKKWTPLGIVLLEGEQANMVYDTCGGRSPDKFNWEISSIEWNVCERVEPFLIGQGKLSCIPTQDKIQYLLIDNLRFSAVKESYV